MKTVFIDISILVQTRFLTGIQRVALEVIERLAKMPWVRLVLLTQDADSMGYRQVDAAAFLKKGAARGPEEVEKLCMGSLSLDDMARYPDPVFLDIDSVWACLRLRTELYPELKKRNIRIVTHVYDVIVISHPQFSSLDNILRFPPYIAAAIEYADHIVVNTDYTRQELFRIAKEFGLRRDPQISVIPLGADFAGSRFDASKVHKDALKIAEAGPYVLTVSTIEPRKNHKLLLDAFDSGVDKMGIQMVFAGKEGWNVSELMKRIHSHPRYQKTLFHLTGMNDDTIRFLYQHAMMVLFPTYIEGFGLSTIEAIQQGTPVACSDIPVMREVGGEFCDYFDLHRPEDVVRILKHYKEDPKAYQERREKLKDYRAFTWDDMVNRLAEVLGSTWPEPEASRPEIRQMMMLTSRADSFLGTVPFVEALMPFIRELVIFCPEKTGAEIREKYQGRLSIRCVSDEELLQGRPLPRDHQTRNFYLRALAIQSDAMDPYFIMSDDDYRPLCQVDESFFFQDGRMNAYYFHDLDLYCRDIPVSTSFDEGMHRLNRFLHEKGLPNLCYASHMPQIICKAWFREMLEMYPELLELGCCEWSTYFNIESTMHPEAFRLQPCRTLMWPGDVTNWARFVEPDEYVFENHYPEAYAEGGLLAGCAQDVQSGAHADAEEKIRRYRDMWSGKQKRAEEIFDAYCREFRTRYGTRPQIMFTWNGDHGEFAKLEYIRTGENAAIRMRVEVMDPVYAYLEKSGVQLDIGWNYGTEQKLYNRSRVLDREHPIVFTFLIPPAGTTTAIHLGYEIGDGVYHECVSIPLTIE